MSCKYKYKDSWYSKQELQELLYKERGITKEGKLIKPNISNNNPVIAQTTKENTTSIESVKNKLGVISKEDSWAVEASAPDEYAVYTYMGKFVEGQPTFNSKEEAQKWLEENKPKEKEYTEQALINTKIAKLKEVAKKYPRSLIRSEVKSINNSSYLGFNSDELPFQKASPFKNGKLQVGKFSITEEEFNSMTKDEQDNLLKCL